MNKSLSNQAKHTYVQPSVFVVRVKAEKLFATSNPLQQDPSPWEDM